MKYVPPGKQPHNELENHDAIHGKTHDFANFKGQNGYPLVPSVTWLAEKKPELNGGLNRKTTDFYGPCSIAMFADTGGYRRGTEWVHFTFDVMDYCGIYNSSNSLKMVDLVAWQFRLEMA